MTESLTHDPDGGGFVSPPLPGRATDYGETPIRAQQAECAYVQVIQASTIIIIASMQ